MHRQTHLQRRSGFIGRKTNPDGHYYITYEGGLSGSNEPQQWKVAQPFTDNNCRWLPIGTTAPPQISNLKSYARSTSYNQFDVVYVPLTVEYYVQNQPGGCTSAATVPVFTSKSLTTDETLPLTDGKTTGGAIQWLDQGSYNAACGKKGSPPWTSQTHYDVGVTICNPREKGRQYKALISGATSKTELSRPSLFT